MLSVANTGCFSFLSTVKFAKSHEWVKVDSDRPKEATIGITDFAQKALGDLVFVELPEKGKNLKKEDVAAVVESVKSVSNIYSPIAGEVSEANAKLKETPGLMNTDPNGEGWIYKLKLKNLDDFENLMDEKAYAKHCESEEH